MPIETSNTDITTPDLRLYRALILAKEKKDAEIYSRFIMDMALASVEIRDPSSNLDWMGQTEFSLIVVDLDMNEGLTNSWSSTGFLEKIKAAHPKTSVVYLTSKPTIEEAVVLTRLGAEDYLSKPLDMERFRQALYRGLENAEIYGTDRTIEGYLGLVNCCHMISSTMDQERILTIAEMYLKRELRGSVASVFEMKCGARAVTQPQAERDKSLRAVLDEIIKRNEVRDWVQSVEENPKWRAATANEPAIFVMPFEFVPNLKYFLIVLSPEVTGADTALSGRVEMLKSQLEVSGRYLQRYRGVEHLVYVDDVTGLYNTRYLKHLLEREVEMSKKSNKPFAVLFMDLDDFKSVNDQHGHLVGTKLLKEFGQVLRRYLRSTDVVFRYGGDEFVVLLLDTTLDAAKDAAERVRSYIEKRTFLSREGLDLRMTVSVGISLFPDHGQHYQPIIDAADKAMYVVKNSRKNAVAVAGKLRISGNKGVVRRTKSLSSRTKERQD